MCCWGYGVAQDYAEALQSQKLAVAQGHGMALKNVGGYHEMGFSVAVDSAEAIGAADALKRLGAQ
jgi:TPR repeat protein